MAHVFLPLVSSGTPARKRRTVCSREPKLPLQLNLATYNIGYEPDNWVMAAGERADRIAEQLDEYDVEIIGLQEVMHRGDRAEVEVLAKLFSGWDAYTVPHNKNNHYSNMILSVYPILLGSERTHTIKSPAGRNDRVNLSVKVKTPAGVVRVFDIHTRFEEASNGTKQIMDWVLQVSAAEPGTPFVLLGDFNTGRTKVLAAAEDAGLRLQATRSGRIDHILTSGLQIVEDCTVARPGVPGEHDPVFATVSA